MAREFQDIGQQDMSNGSEVCNTMTYLLFAERKIHGGQGATIFMDISV